MEDARVVEDTNTKNLEEVIVKNVAKILKDATTTICLYCLKFYALY